MLPNVLLSNVLISSLLILGAHNAPREASYANGIKQQPPKITLNIWYRGAIELGIKNVVPAKSGDTIRFFKRELSSYPRVYSIQYNRADWVPMNVEVQSFGKKKVIRTSRPPFTFKTGKVDFSDDFVEMKEDFVQVTITFRPGVGRNETYVFNLNLVRNRP